MVGLPGLSAMGLTRLKSSYVNIFITCITPPLLWIFSEL